MRDDTNGGPAFPRPAFASGTLESNSQAGMSLRDYFAGQAMQGLLTDPNYTAECIGDDAYSYADAMIEARNK